MDVPHEDTSKYGIIDPGMEVEKGLFNVKNFVEKPAPENAPSDLAIIGRYLLTPEIFDIFGFLKTSIEYGLVHPEVKDNLKEYLIELGKELAPAQKEVKEAPKASKK